MTTYRRVAVSAFACLLSIAGCHSGTDEPRYGGGGEASAGPPAPDGAAAVDPRAAGGFCDGYLSTLASYLVRCLALSPAQAAQLLDGPLLCDRFTGSVNAGRTRFDSSAASACLAELAAAPCA